MVTDCSCYFKNTFEKVGIQLALVRNDTGVAVI
jgi:hypothetical protein